MSGTRFNAPHLHHVKLVTRPIPPALAVAWQQTALDPLGLCVQLFNV